MFIKKNDIKYLIVIYVEFGMSWGLIVKKLVVKLKIVLDFLFVVGCNDIVGKIIYLLIKCLFLRKKIFDVLEKYKYLVFFKFYIMF